MRHQKAIRVASGYLALTCCAVGVGRSEGYREWRYACLPGTFRACASVSIRVGVPVFDGSVGQLVTPFTVTVANPQGSVAGLGNPGLYGLAYLRFNHLLAVAPPWALGERHGYSVTTTGAVGGGWPPFHVYPDIFWVPSWRGIPDGGGQQVEFSSNRSTVYGCDRSPFAGAPTGYYPWTCGGSIAMSFGVIGWYDLTDDTGLGLAFQLGDDGSGYGYCSTESDCILVTPEPVAIALLATGLVGVGAARLRRRGTRRHNDVEPEELPSAAAQASCAIQIHRLSRNGERA